MQAGLFTRTSGGETEGEGGGDFHEGGLGYACQRTTDNGKAALAALTTVNRQRTTESRVLNTENRVQLPCGCMNRKCVKML